MAKLYTLAWLILTFTAIIVSDRDDGNMTLCSPFKALIIWSANTFVATKFDLSLVQQQRFLLDFLKATPDGSHVCVVFVGNKKSEFKFKKNSADESYVDNISNNLSNFKTFFNNIVDYKTVSDAVFHFFDRNESPKLSEQVFFISNENTTINDIAKVQEATKKKKRYVVIYGKHYGDEWTALALDKEHIQVLGKTENDIEPAVNYVKKLSCKDSQHVCDVDQYLTDEKEKRCYRCSYICSKFKNMDSEYCSSECPYFKRLELHEDNLLKDHSWSDICSLSIFNTILIVLIIMFIRKDICVQLQNLRVWWSRNVMKYFQGRSPLPQNVDANDELVECNSRDHVPLVVVPIQPKKSSLITPLKPRDKYAQETENTAIAASNSGREQIQPLETGNTAIAAINLGRETAEQIQPMETENTAIAASNSGREQIQPLIHNQPDNADEDYPNVESYLNLDTPDLHEPPKK